MKAKALLALLFCFPSAAFAADILGAFYDPARDAIVVDIAYRGTKPDHAFSLEWGECSSGPPYQAVGRLVDLQGDDIARRDFTVRNVFSLDTLPCRPVEVTLRLGRVSIASVFVPPEPQASR